MVCRRSRAQPRRPAKLALEAQPQSGHLFALEVQTNIPVELETQVEPYPVHEPSQQDPLALRAVLGWARRRKKRFVLLQRQGSDVNAELALMVPHAGAQHGTGTEDLAIGLQIACDRAVR